MDRAVRRNGNVRGAVDKLKLRRGEPANTSTDARVGCRFEDHVYSDARGRRDYKLYVPTQYHGQALPLIVMLHGCTQTPDDFAAGTRMNELAEAHGFLVAYPAQSRSANASKCWNWFNTADQGRDSGEAGLIAGLTRQIMLAHGVDKRRIYVAGLSAGGAAAANLGSAYPDLYAAIGVHSGLACGAARDLPSAFVAMRQGAPSAPAARGGVPTIVFHGDRDSTVHAVNGDQVMAQARAGATLKASEALGVSDGGARYRRTIYVNDNGLPVFEQWVLHGAGHAWAGGSAKGSYTDPAGAGRKLRDGALLPLAPSCRAARVG